MSSAVWPSTLPPRPLLEVQYSEQDTAVRSPADSGPGQVRRRFTRPVKSFTCDVLLTGSQLATFVAWYDGDLDGGAGTFDWPHPITHAHTSMRFVRRPGPWAQVRTGTQLEALWSSRFELEILP